MFDTVFFTLSESDKVSLGIISSGNWANIVWIDTSAPFLINNCFQHNLIVDATNFQLECRLGLVNRNEIIAVCIIDIHSLFCAIDAEHNLCNIDTTVKREVNLQSVTAFDPDFLDLFNHDVWL